MQILDALRIPDAANYLLLRWQKTIWTFLVNEISLKFAQYWNYYFSVQYFCGMIDKTSTNKCYDVKSIIFGRSFSVDKLLKTKIHHFIWIILRETNLGRWLTLSVKKLLNIIAWNFWKRLSTSNYFSRLKIVWNMCTSLDHLLKKTGIKYLWDSDKLKCAIGSHYRQLHDWSTKNETFFEKDFDQLDETSW